jgi:hypothetical protein
MWDSSARRRLCACPTKHRRNTPPVMGIPILNVYLRIAAEKKRILTLEHWMAKKHKMRSDNLGMGYFRDETYKSVFLRKNSSQVPSTIENAAMLFNGVRRRTTPPCDVVRRRTQSECVHLQSATGVRIAAHSGLRGASLT